MRYFLAAFTAAAILAGGFASAQDVNGSLRQAANLDTSPANPRAFTPAPISPLSPGKASDYRVNRWADAGPADATPFSGSVGTVLTGSSTARSLNSSSPDRDPTGSAQFGD